MVGIVSDPLFMNHDTGGYHPEAPMRIHSIHTVFAGKDPEIRMVEPVRADTDEIALNHARSHIERVRLSSVPGKLVGLDPDTVSSEDSFETALYAAGSLIRLVQMAVAGEITAGFASLRPPGHHATAGEAMGFCLFNNVAIAARKAVQCLGVEKVMIIDSMCTTGTAPRTASTTAATSCISPPTSTPFTPAPGGSRRPGTGRPRGIP
jgi:acetoin utilization deacetylase AcuC-like enzyme